MYLVVHELGTQLTLNVQSLLAFLKNARCMLWEVVCCVCVVFFFFAQEFLHVSLETKTPFGCRENKQYVRIPVVL